MECSAFLSNLQKLLETSRSASETSTDFSRFLAARWRRQDGRAFLQGIGHVQSVALDRLLCIDEAKAVLDRNTRQFVRGAPANDVLLWGGRGTGKSSLVKAMLTRYGTAGLRLIELDKDGLLQLPDVVAALRRGDPDKRYRYILFCDDLSFEDDEPAYKALKSVLDGGIEARPENILIYATSNRRHLMPRYFSENQEYQRSGEEILPGESAEEKLSLSDRFGVWIGFYPFNQDSFLHIVKHHLMMAGCTEDEAASVGPDALRWALARGSRSGRVASQFVSDYLGRRALSKGEQSNENE